MVVNDDGLTLSEDQFTAFMFQLNAIEHSFFIRSNFLQDDTALFDDIQLFVNNYEQQQQPQAVEVTVQQQPKVDEVTVQQQLQPVEDTVHQQQLRYDNDGVLEI